MSLKFSAFIGARLTRAKRRNIFVSFISFASMLGIALGVAALITVLSVMNGFNHEMQDRILSMSPHVSVLPYDRSMGAAPALERAAAANPEIIGAIPFVQGQAMLMANGLTHGAMLRGIESERVDQVYPLSEHVTNGQLEYLQPGEFGMVLGEDLCKYLGLHLGDKVTVIIPELKASPMGVMPRLKRFTVVGTFKVGYLFDNNFSFINMADASKLFHLNGEVSGWHLRLNNYLSAPRVRKTLSQEFQEYYFSDWTRENSTYFEAVKMEKTLMFVILSLIIAVAAFNLIATLVMVVNEKEADIAILRTMGATPKTIRQIFMIQGGIIGVSGTLLGLLGGIYIATHITAFVDAVQSYFQVELLAKDVYFVSFLPSRLEPNDVLLVSSLALVMALVATIYPAWRAARIQPAEALRYE